MPENNQKPYDIDILVVEDDVPSRIYLTTIIKSLANKVHVAANGQEGLELFDKHRPEIVVSDIGMPIMNGLEMSRRIKDIDPSAQIILTTAFDNKEAFIDAIDIGINQYILKPVKRPNLIKALDRVYAGIMMQREIGQKNEYIRTLSRAVEHSSGMIMLLNPDGIIEYANPRLLSKTGYQADEVIGSSPRDYKYSEADENIFEDYIETVSKGNTWRGEYQNKTKSGEPYWVLSSISPIKSDSGEITHLVVVSEDITARKEEEQELEKSRDLLEKKVRERTRELRKTNEELLGAKEAAESANRAKSLFLAKVSHELRTPMNGILGMTSILLDTNLTDKQRRSLGIVKYSADSLLNIINDILDFSKLEAGKLNISPETFRLAGIIDQSINVVRNAAENKGLDLDIVHDPEVPKYVIGDPHRLQQVLVNLLGNAIKFTEEGRVSLECGLLSKDESKAEVQFRVSDTGIGIPQSKIDRLFQSFSQIDGNLTRKYGGTGLGLAISRELVELMGGTIGVESREGEGSEFFVNIPFEIAEAPDQIEAEDYENGTGLKSIAAKFPHPELNILVAEDSEINQEVIREALSAMNWRTTLVSDGYEAVQKYLAGEFDAILMDVQMPRMDGLEASRKIRSIEKSRDSRRIPIIGLTAHTADSHKIECFRAGMDHYIAKPYKWEDIFKAILSQSGHDLEPEAFSAVKLAGTLNNPKLFKKIRDYFIEKYPEELADLDMAISHGDAMAARDIAHKMKSEISNFGAERAFRIAGKIESAAREGSLAECGEMLKELRTEFKQVETQLSNYKLQE
ncbi:MAG: response regulator [Candidatus Kapaibacterium sp.]